MKKILLKLVIFFSPFFIFWLFVFLIDPYNLFNVSHIIPDDAKKKCLNRSNKVAPRANILWNIINYNRHPTSGIFIGDSKIEDIPVSSLKKISGQEISKMFIPGADYSTLKNIFWMAAKTGKLKEAIVQVSFINTNNQNIDLYANAMETIKHPYKYFFELNYIKDSFSVLYYSITKNNNFICWKNKIKGDPWDISEKWIKELLTNNWEYPESFFQDFQKIADYCIKNNINLYFVITPTYFKMDSIIKNKHLTNEYNRFVSNLNKISYTINLNNGQPISFNKNNYYDYLHLKPFLADSLLSMIYEKIPK